MGGKGVLFGSLSALGTVLALCAGGGGTAPPPFEPDWSQSRHAAAPPSAALTAAPRIGIAGIPNRDVFVLCNVDDDDGDRRPDRDDPGIDGQGDADDLTHIVLHRLGAATSDDIAIRIASSAGVASVTATGVRVFDASGVVRLGPTDVGHRSTWVLEDAQRAALATADLSLYVEGLAFGATDVLEVLRDGAVVDRVTLRVSPLQIAPSYGEASHILYPTLPPKVSTNADRFREALETGLDQAGLDASSRTTIELDPNQAGDWWIQDQVQWAYTHTPDVFLPVAILLPRSGLLRPSCESLLGPDVGAVEPVPPPGWGEAVDGGLYGGNLEALPATGPDTPGLVYGGFLPGPEVAVAATAGPEQQVGAEPCPLSQFLAQASPQALVRIDTRLTYVGHVDELVALVPPATPGGKTYLLVASPDLGVGQLDDAERPPEDPDCRIQALYAPLLGVAESEWEAEKTCKQVRPPEAPALVTWSDILAVPTLGLETMTLREYNQALGRRIHGTVGAVPSLYAQLEARLTEAGVDFDRVLVPTLFRPSPTADAIENGVEGPLLARGVALVPNMVNLIAFPGHLITSDPTVARFLQTLEGAFPAAGEEGHVRVHPIDVYDLLHESKGGIHCATNVRYEPSGLFKWWEAYP